MLDQTVGRTAAELGSGLGAGDESTASYLLALALSPMGLTLMAAALVVALWKARG